MGARGVSAMISYDSGKRPIRKMDDRAGAIGSELNASGTLAVAKMR